jgi:precorrin-8X/cobalt-precorrin-8 methylmutase
VTAYDYLRDPAAIERESFVRIRACTALQRLDRQQAQVAMRIVHSAGDPALVQQLHFSADAVSAGMAALKADAPLLCDTEMVSRGISRAMLDSPVHCFLNAEGVPALAKQRGATRTMAALDHWLPLLPGGIAVIGNAPTALFRLLEMLADGAPQPALIIGMPVGFVGAAESKQALLEFSAVAGRPPMITLSGRAGGSALAASVVNALARMNRGIYL